MGVANHTAKIRKMLDGISAAAYADEEAYVKALSRVVEAAEYDHKAAAYKAQEMIEAFRAQGKAQGLEAFFLHYGLDTKEGIAVMELAEALLRIPDNGTANALIHDKLTHTNWLERFNGSSSLVKMSSVGLHLAGKLFELGNIVSSLANPVVRESVRQSMRMMGNHFVMGETIEEAIKRSAEYTQKGYVISYDMLGEAARSDVQAKGYLRDYLDAVTALGANVDNGKELYRRHSISVKLSALHPRYNLLQRTQVLEHLLPRLKDVVAHAMEVGICVTIDAEEMARLDLSLELLDGVLSDSAFRGFDGIGLAVQAYHLRAYKVIDYVAELADLYNRRIPVRLVKGAYWDTEIKRAQVGGFGGYPVLTNKVHTDISYLACMSSIFKNSDYIYPQIATHNALSIASAMQMAGDKSFEFQLLHGMGQGLYDPLASEHSCRIYAPVGKHKELLPYLIRRLLENGANSSFVKALADEEMTVASLTEDPMAVAREQKYRPYNDLPLPKHMYRRRKNSSGLDLGNRVCVADIRKKLDAFKEATWQAAPLISGKAVKGEAQLLYSPQNLSCKTGEVVAATSNDAKHALDVACAAYAKWEATPAKKRAAILEKLAKLLEKNRFELMALCMREAGKTLQDSIDEVREAVDFCRYYAQETKRLFAKSTHLPGPVGEHNSLSFHGRGVFVCISPWNFPLAIFTGQITAALGAGNCVIAKPAEQTPLIAAMAVKLMYKAGIPKDVLHLLPGSGEVLGKMLLSDVRVAGVAFTGSNHTAKIIHRTLALRGGAIPVLVAETGGQNAMIVDSTALLEQVVDDIILSAFGSAGQRCSGLRVLYVQEEVKDSLTELLSGAMMELKVGDPADLATDVGPVIDRVARQNLTGHIKKMTLEHKLVAAVPLDKNLAHDGTYIAPHAFEISSVNDLPGEVFGPIVHIIGYKRNQIDKVIAEINDCGFGLTLGIHSRIGSFADFIRARVRVGNIYVNRSMTGAVVGTQPFGGEGMSGTGPKAGGPHYMPRFAVERTYTVNTAAIGGDRELLV